MADPLAGMGRAASWPRYADCQIISQLYAPSIFDGDRLCGRPCSAVEGFEREE